MNSAPSNQENKMSVQRTSMQGILELERWSLANRQENKMSVQRTSMKGILELERWSLANRE